MKNKDWSKKLKYWFDNQMAKGTAVMIVMLTCLMLIVVVCLTLLIVVFSNGKIQYGETLWTVLATTINAWMPEADEDIVRMLLVSVAAIFGLFFTSFIIGIISSAVEDKLTQLRHGNSKVIEQGHIVVLGLKEGNFTLVQQLVMSAGDKKSTIVIAEDIEKTELENAINGNILIPKNVKIICRCVNTIDPVELECCSLETADLIVIQPIEDLRTIKTLLAVSTYLENFQEANPRIISAIDNDENMIPRYIRRKYGFTMLRTNSIIGRIMAQSCKQQGLANAFEEVFDFSGNEFYAEKIQVRDGDLFKHYLYFMDSGVPIGFIRDGVTYLNPERNTKLVQGDTLIVFEEEQGKYKLLPKREMIDPEKLERSEYENNKVSLLILGENEKLGYIISELPKNITHVMLADSDSLLEIKEQCEKLRNDIIFETTFEDISDLDNLEKLTAKINHVMILSDEKGVEESADAHVMITLLKLRDIKMRLKRDFTITAEVRREDDRQLLKWNDSVDFIVSSNMSAMVITQVAKCADLYETFHELLSTEGVNLEIREATTIPNCIMVEKTISELRREMIKQNCILLGYIDDDNNTVLNPSATSKMKIKAKDKLIVIAS